MGVHLAWTKRRCPRIARADSVQSSRHPSVVALDGAPAGLRHTADYVPRPTGTSTSGPLLEGELTKLETSKASMAADGYGARTSLRATWSWM